MSHDTYELPSIYTSRKVEINNRYDSDEEDEINLENSLPSINPSALTTKRSTFRDVHVEDNRLAWLLLCSSLSILVMTAVPAVFDLPDMSPWFTGDALFRFFDPVITLPLNLFIITRADVMTTGRSNYWGALSEASVVWLIWSFGAALYVQFHGVHTASALFKHPIQDFNLAHPELVAEYPVLHEMYSNMRDLWEHYIAHYLYAGGAMIMSWAQLFAFRNQVHGPLPTTTKIVWIIGTIVYGLLLAGVAIQFPDGTKVGLVYSILIGSVCVAMLLFNQKNLKSGGLFTMGRRMVIQFYLGACILGLLVIIIWISIFGFLNRKGAGF